MQKRASFGITAIATGREKMAVEHVTGPPPAARPVLHLDVA